MPEEASGEAGGAALEFWSLGHSQAFEELLNLTFLSLPGEQCNMLGESEAGGIKLTLDPPTDLLEPSHLAISTPPSLSSKSLFKAVHPMRFSPCGPALTPPSQWYIPCTHRRGCGLLWTPLSPGCNGYTADAESDPA